MKLYLASNSPRRRELLRQIGIEFEVLPPQVAEHVLPDESASAHVTRLALEKARAGARLRTQRGLAPGPVLGADTAVVVDGEILGKPRDRGHGLAMLRRLSGRSHDVLTALCVVHDGTEHCALSASSVTMKPLEEPEIARYWASGEPQDKAGGYAIQGYAAAFVARLEGSYSGVVGLPLYELTLILRRIGLPV